MVSSLFLAALLAAAGLGSALPPKIGTTVIGDDGFSFNKGRATVKQARNPNYRFNGARSIYQTYLKYGAEIPDYLLKAVAHIESAAGVESRADKGSAPAIPIDDTDMAWITPVTIGTPPQTLNLDFDTGSSDLWVFSSHLPSNQVRGQALYNPNKSNTSKLLSDHSWSISYGDGSRSRGNVYIDTFTVGGLTVASQAVEAAQQVSTSFTRETHMDGLLGLGFSSLNTVSPKRQTTFFDNLKGQLEKPVFAVDFKNHKEGTYDFGFIDPAKHTGNISYVPVNTDPGYWMWTASGYGVGEGEFTPGNINGIADTGTTLLYLSQSIVSAYYRQVQGSSNSRLYGGYVFPCNANLPAFTFGVGTARISIPGKYMNYGPAAQGSSSCFGGLQSNSQVGINIWGGVALKAAFVVFDASAKPMIGWASKTLN